MSQKPGFKEGGKGRGLLTTGKISAERKGERREPQTRYVLGIVSRQKNLQTAANREQDREAMIQGKEEVQRALSHLEQKKRRKGGSTICSQRYFVLPDRPRVKQEERALRNPRGERLIKKPITDSA